MPVIVEDLTTQPLHPFLKWAGGKRWLVNSQAHLFNISFKRLIEPFLGSGAVFFHLRPNDAILSDLNLDLIETYLAIREEWEEVYYHLRRHQELHSKRYYYKIRESHPKSSTSKAAKFIYLNRTCWNGLFRVNSEGKFNVPIGTKSNVLLETDNFKEISNALKFAEIYCDDFGATIEKSEKEDLVYIDPPYTVCHNKNGFLKYNQKIFSWADQVRLRDSVASAIKKGAHVVVSNANHSSVQKLYKALGKPFSVERHSVLSGSPTYRKKVDELIFVSN